MRKSGSGDEMPAEMPTIVVTSVPRNRNRTTSTSEKDGNVHIKGSKTIYTAGRPPWYNSSGQMKDALVIGKLQYLVL